GNGVRVPRPRPEFHTAAKKTPAGSYVVKCAQASRPHVLDMFEPQDHPNDFAYPGAPPTPPYDSAGYTPAFTMGVQFDRILDGFDGPFEELRDEIPPPPARVTIRNSAAGFFLDTRMNDSFLAVNRRMQAGEEVRRLQKSLTIQGTTYPAGTFFVARKASTPALLERIARDLGTPFAGSEESPGNDAPTVKPVRIGLWDRVG